MASRPYIGVAAIIHDGAGKIVMGQRQGSHGAGTWAFPGGHLEFGESFSNCAKREVLEETGLEIGQVNFLVATNDVMEAEGKHYVTVFVICVIEGEKKEPEPMEPEKCAKWEWIDWSEMWSWAKGQAEAEAQKATVTKNRLFLPIVNLYRQYPSVEKSLGKQVT